MSQNKYTPVQDMSPESLAKELETCLDKQRRKMLEYALADFQQWAKSKGGYSKCSSS